MNKSNLHNQENLTTRQASKILDITPKAIHEAIKNKKLKATFKTTRWIIHKDDLLEYKKNKYNREKSLFRGRPLYDTDKGEYSVNKAAEILKTNPNRIYYLIRHGDIKCRRKGSCWIVTREEINRIYLTETRHKKNKRGIYKKAMGD